jgi:hypothetical protein
MTQQLPDNIAALISLLDKTFPLRSWPASTTLVEVHRHAGARDVIEWLSILHREATERYSDDQEA